MKLKVRGKKKLQGTVKISGSKNSAVAIIAASILSDEEVIVRNVPEIDDVLTNEMLLKEQKMIKEMIDTCPANRTDLMTEYENRMAIVKEFAPQLITDPTEITLMITSIVPTGTAFVKSNKGAIMKCVTPYFKGKADMKIVSQVVNDMLC